MPEIQVPELARKLARRFNVTGGSVAPTLAPEIVPIALVEDLTTPDTQDTGFERNCFGAEAPGAAAGNYSHIQLLNPAGSGTALVVEGVIVSRASAGLIRLHAHDTALTTAGSALGFRDRRITGAPTAQIRYQNNAALLGSGRGFFNAPAAESITVPLDVILLEGHGILVAPDTQNTAVAATFYWLERAILPNE